MTRDEAIEIVRMGYEERGEVVDKLCAHKVDCYIALGKLLGIPTLNEPQSPLVEKLAKQFRVMPCQLHDWLDAEGLKIIEK